MNEVRYRAAERKVWESVGMRPDERRIRLRCTGTEIRVQIVGDGPPVLFLHGGPNSGTTWASLVEHLSGFRCLIIDRPGTGLSDDHVIRGDMCATADRFVGDVLDALDIERAHVVASSFGGFLALRSAAAAPARLDRMVQMACPAMAPGMKTPPFMKMMRFAFVRWLVPKLPPSRKTSLDILRQIGHGASIDAGRFDSGPFFEWYLELQRHTNTMKNDLAMIGGALRGEAFDPALTLEPAVLGAVTTPTLFLWGADDGFGGDDVARAVVAAMPNAELEMFPGFGHLPWLDDPKTMAAKTAAFLARA